MLTCKVKSCFAISVLVCCFRNTLFFFQSNLLQEIIYTVDCINVYSKFFIFCRFVQFGFTVYKWQLKLNYKLLKIIIISVLFTISASAILPKPF